MTIQDQQRPKTTTRGSEKSSTLKKSMLASSASLLLLSALAATATAEIAFTSPPPNSVYRPGDSFALTWTIRPPNGTVPVNTDPFDLQLRAATLQRYTIQTAVAQSALTLQVQIPADVTGGLVSFCSLVLLLFVVCLRIMMVEKEIVISIEFSGTTDIFFFLPPFSPPLDAPLFFIIGYETTAQLLRGL